MRFEDYLKWSETGRYGRATNLRLVQLVTLRPGEALFTWTGRVDNPLPIRYGFKLWWLLRQPADEGTRVILPAAATTGHNAPNLNAWDHSATITKDMRVKSVFAIGIRHGFGGWHMPHRDFNVLRVLDHTTAPGAKQVLYRAHPEGYIEMWGGNNEVFEECGRILPAFGGYEIEMKVLPSKGIGLPDFANEHGTLALTRTNDNWTVTLAPTRKLNGAKLWAESGTNTADTLVSAAPDKPVSWHTGITNASFMFRLRDNNGKLLMEQQLPVDVGPLPREEFRAAQERTRTKTRGRKGETLTIMPGGALLHAEATDLLSEHQLSLPRAKRRLFSLLGRTRDRVELLDTTRRIMRLTSRSTNVLAGIERVLETHPDDPHANLYKAVWLLESDRGKEARKFLARANSLPGARYLLALDAMSRKKYRTVIKHIEKLLTMGPEQTFWGKSDHSLGLLQPGCFIAATRPKLLLALARQAQGRDQEARRVLSELVESDPACIEAWMLLGDAERIRTLTERNDSGKRAAEKTLAALRAGQWRGIGRPR
jgi:hypothetical protein